MRAGPIVAASKNNSAIVPLDIRINDSRRRDLIETFSYSTLDRRVILFDSITSRVHIARVNEEFNHFAVFTEMFSRGFSGNLSHTLRPILQLLPYFFFSLSLL